MNGFVMTPAVAWLEAHERPSWEHGFYMPRGLARIKEDHAEGGFCAICKQSGEVIVIEPDDWQPSPAVEWLESGYDGEMKLGECDYGDGRRVAAAAPWWRPHVQPMFMLKDDAWAPAMSWFASDD